MQKRIEIWKARKHKGPTYPCKKCKSQNNGYLLEGGRCLTCWEKLPKIKAMRKRLAAGIKYKAPKRALDDKEQTKKTQGLIDRCNELMEHYRFSISDFARFIDVTPSSFHKFMGGNMGIKGQGYWCEKLPYKLRNFEKRFNKAMADSTAA